MPLTPGYRLGPYEITGSLGAGGVGEVYSATDTRLDRTVALKVLPAELASDPDRRERFEREAKAIAALNHPHICTLHDVGHEDGTDFLVMEHLEGESLQDRLTKGALALDQALEVAIQIADALDKAHRQGITHRDLKPGNIFLTKSGAKLLDFGLAKLKDIGPAGQQPTKLADSLTAQGTILGTFHYMAPEQLEGQEADARSDIWAFGCVVYEMVTGAKAFEGTSQASLIGVILHKEPAPLSSLVPLSPPALNRLVTTCLEKGADDRWQSAGDLGRQLRWLTEGGSQTDRPDVPAIRRPERERLWMATSGVLAVLLAALGVFQLTGPAADVQTTRFSVRVESGSVSGIALSPDGTHLAFVTGRGYGQLWVRSVDSTDARLLAGIEEARTPFWSPDGRSIGFFTVGELKVIDLTLGASPRTVSRVEFRGINSAAYGGTWNQDDVILFGGSAGGLLRVSANGGEPTSVTTLDTSPGEMAHRWPQFLPDGVHFIFLGGTDAGDEPRGVYVGSLDAGTTEPLGLQTRTMARYAAPGYLLFGRSGGLMAQTFDVERPVLTDDPVRAVEAVFQDVVTNWVGFSTSDQGDLTYVGADSATPTQLRWFDRSGTDLGTSGTAG